MPSNAIYYEDSCTPKQVQNTRQKKDVTLQIIDRT